MKKSFLLGGRLMLAAWLGATCGLAQATTWSVPAQYATIQAAIDNAAVNSGDVIEVTAPATEGGFSITNGKNLVIRKVGTGQVLMTNQCNLLGAITARVEGIDISSPNVGVYVDANSSLTLSGMTINGTNGNSAIYMTNSAGGTLRIENSTLLYSGAGSVDAIQVHGAPALTLSATAITDAGRVGVLLADTAGSSLNLTNGSVIGNCPQQGIWALANNVTVTVTDSSISTNTQHGVYMESTGGVLNMTRATVNNNVQIGVYLVKGTAATLTDCVIRNNSQQGLARINNAGQATTISVTGGEIRNNGGNGGIDIVETGAVSLSGVTVQGNSNFGLYLRDRAVGPLTIGGCTFQGNTVNTIRATGQTGANIVQGNVQRTILRDGSSGAQPNVYLINGNANVQFTNCVFDEGSQLLYGRTDANSTSITLGVDFCTFVSRTGLGNTGLQALAEVSDNQKIAVAVRNSIFAGVANGIQVDGGSTIKSVANNYNLMNAQTNQYQGIAAAGANDRTGDPKFITATSGVGTANLHLQTVLPPSPAIDAANLALSPGVSADIEGTARPLPLGTAADMGAYEEQTVPVELSTFEVI